MLQHFFYIGACEDLALYERAGIWTYQLGEMPEVCSFLPFPWIGYLISNKSGNRLYAVLQGAAEGGVASFNLEAVTGQPSLLSSQKAQGNPCCHLALSPDERFLFATNYQSAQLMSYPVDDRGQIGNMVQCIQWQGRGPHPRRQASAHLHYCQFSPDEKYLLVVDLGSDKVLAFPWDNATGMLGTTPVENQMDPGDGPRHLLSAPDGEHLWLINELGGSVTTLRYQGEGRLTIQDKISILEPETDKERNTSGALRLSPQGDYVVATNRGENSIVLCKIQEDYSLSICNKVSCKGNFPRDCNFIGECQGRPLLLCLYEKSGDGEYLLLDRGQGKFLPYAEPEDGKIFNLPRPITLVSLEKNY